jgi:hypothetical protein
MERKGGEVRLFVCVVCEAEFERERKPGRPPTVCSSECRAEDNRRRAKGWYHANPARIAEQPSRSAEHKRQNNAAYYAANRAREIQRSLAYARGRGRDRKRARDAARFALTRGAPTPSGSRSTRSSTGTVASATCA